MERIYLDNAATTPLDKEVMTEMLHVMNNYYGNPSSIHAQGRESTTSVSKMQGKPLPELLNATPAEIFFTSGGTEAIIRPFVAAFAAFNIKHAITSKIEHHAVAHTLKMLLNKKIID